MRCVIEGNNDLGRKKNLDLEFMRYIMILSVAVLHFNEDYTGSSAPWPGGYLGVDFFFLVGGLFLAQHYDRHKTDEPPVIQARDYLICRLKRLYPPYLCAILLMVAIRFVNNGMSFSWLVWHVYETKWQYLFLHYLGPGISYEMRSIWFLSPFVLLSFLIYFLLSYNKRLFVGICPVVSLFILVHIYETYGSLSMQEAWEGWLYGAVLRAFSEMSLGVYLYEVVARPGCNDRHQSFAARGKAANFLVGAVEIGALAMLLMTMHWFGADKNDFFSFFLIVLFVILSYRREQGYRNQILRKAVAWLGAINYWMFLLHLILCQLLVQFAPGIEYWKILPVYIAALTAVSSIALLLERKAREKLRAWTCKA